MQNMQTVSMGRGFYTYTCISYEVSPEMRTPQSTSCNATRQSACISVEVYKEMSNLTF